MDLKIQKEEIKGKVSFKMDLKEWVKYLENVVGGTGTKEYTYSKYKGTRRLIRRPIFELLGEVSQCLFDTKVFDTGILEIQLRQEEIDTIKKDLIKLKVVHDYLGTELTPARIQKRLKELEV